MINRNPIFSLEGLKAIQNNSLQEPLNYNKSEATYARDFKSYVSQEVGKSTIDASLSGGIYSIDARVKMRFMADNTNFYNISTEKIFYKFSHVYKKFNQRTILSYAECANYFSEQFIIDLAFAKANHNVYPLFQKYGTHVIMSGIVGAKLELAYHVNTMNMILEESEGKVISSGLDITEKITNTAASSSLASINSSFFGSKTSKVEATLSATSYGGNSNGANILTGNYGNNYQNWLSSFDSEGNKLTLIQLNATSLVPIWYFLITDEYAEFKHEAFMQYEEKYNQGYQYTAAQNQLLNDLETNKNNYQEYVEKKHAEHFNSLKYQRTEAKQIDDSNSLFYDEIILNKGFTDKTIQQLRNYGYTKLITKVEMDMQEVSDGYFQIYFANNINKNKIFNQFEYDLPNKNITHKSFYITMNLSDIINNRFFIIYSASGVNADVWKSSNLNISFEYLK